MHLKDLNPLLLNLIVIPKIVPECLTVDAELGEQQIIYRFHRLVLSSSLRTVDDLMVLI